MSKRKAPKNTPPTWIKYALLIFGLLLYANTIGHDYAQDDAIVITENQYTQKGISGIGGLLSKDTFQGFFKVEGKDKLVSGGRYRPLTPIMFAIEYQFFGASPWIGHLINAILYGFTGWLIFIVVTRLLARSNLKNDAWWLGAITAALYLAHPLHTEAVANIKGRDEIVAMLFSLGASYFSLKYLREKKSLQVVLVGALLFLGMLAKETAITYVAVIPLAYMFVKEKTKSWIPIGIAVIGAAALFIGIRSAVLGLDFGGSPLELLNNPFIKIENNQYVPFTFGEKSATIIYTLGKYVQLLVFPNPLTHDYYPRHIEIMHWGNWQVLLSFLTYASLIAAAIFGWAKRKIYSFGIFYFLITLSIVSNIVFPIGTNMSERFMYMPSLGFSLISAWLLLLLKNKFGDKASIAVFGIILISYSVKTIVRNNVWKDNYTLFLTDVTTSTRSAKLLNSVGGEMIAQANKENDAVKKQEMIQEAQIYLQKALEIHPNYKLAFLLLGNSHFYLKDYDTAIKLYNQVLTLDPNYTEGHKNLGVAFRENGKYYGETKGDVSKALEMLRLAEEELPNDSETMRLLGVAYGRVGEMKRAIYYFERELALNPNNASSYFNLGITYQRMGEMEKAAENFEKAKAIDPEILNNNKASN